MTRIAPALMSKLREFIVARMALWFPEERADDLERNIRAAAKELGFEDAETCIEWLLSSPLTRTQIETVASYLTVGETYFWREKDIFEILEQEVVPELIRSRPGELSHNYSGNRHQRGVSAEGVTGGLQELGFPRRAAVGQANVFSPNQAGAFPSPASNQEAGHVRPPEFG